MKVILIIPPDRLSFEPMTYPPLGLLYIAAVLERDGFEVEIVDTRKDSYSIGQADYYGFSATTPQIEDVIELRRKVSWKYPDAFTFIGGAHASWRSKELANIFDAVFVGEADFRISDILKDKMNGIIDCSKSDEDVNLIPFPARHLMPKESIVSKKLWEGERYFNDDSPIATTLITSRGCPWKCSYCGNIPQKVRFRRVYDIINEIVVIKRDYDCNHFRFLDDNFLTNRKRAVDLCRILQTTGVEFRCSARSDLIDDIICKELYAGGCREIGFGVESADDLVLTIIGKGETVEDHKKAIKIAKDNGLKVKIFLMTGLPFESDNTIEMNKWFIEDTQPDKVVVSLFTPFPGSDIYEHPYNYLVDIQNMKWSDYVQSYPTKSLVTTHLCTSEQLTRHHSELIKFVEAYNAR